MFDRHPRMRWGVPVAATALIAGGAAAGLPASAQDGLEPKTAQELLVELQGRTPVPLAGTVAVSADLGLPALPTGSPHRVDMTSLAAGDNTVRVWADGPQRRRMSIIGDSSQADIVRNGSVVWTWNSADNAAARYDLPGASEWPQPNKTPDPAELPSTPQEAAEMALAALDPTTEVTTSGVGQVAGRSVYELVLDPRQGDTLVDQVTIATDADTGTPLRVRVYSTQISDPAFEVGFSSVEFTRPDASVFEFTPPPGAEVTEHEAPDPQEVKAALSDAADAAAQGPEPSVVGTGWSTVVVAEVGPLALQSPQRSPADGEGPAEALALLESLPTVSGSWGSGRVLAGTLFSAILTDDGRVAVGAVQPDALGAALADL